MSKLGQKILKGLKEAIDGDLARVTIEGVTWVRKEELDRLRAENTELTIKIAQTHSWADAFAKRSTEHKAECDRLRAEIERLRDAFADGECFCSDAGCSDPLPDNCPKLLPEVARLRAENEALRAELTTCKEINDAVQERIHQKAACITELETELGRLRAENERLRQRLLRLGEDPDSTYHFTS